MMKVVGGICYAHGPYEGQSCPRYLEWTASTPKGFDCPCIIDPAQPEFVEMAEKQKTMNDKDSALAVARKIVRECLTSRYEFQHIPQNILTEILIPEIAAIITAHDATRSAAVGADLARWLFTDDQGHTTLLTLRGLNETEMAEELARQIKTARSRVKPLATEGDPVVEKAVHATHTRSSEVQVEGLTRAGETARSAAEGSPSVPFGADGKIAQTVAEMELRVRGPIHPEDWCDHCSADLNGVRHILCEKCYRRFDAREDHFGEQDDPKQSG